MDYTHWNSKHNNLWIRTFIETCPWVYVDTIPSTVEKIWLCFQVTVSLNERLKAAVVDFFCHIRRQWNKP